MNQSLTTPALEIRILPIARLKPAAYNPRRRLRPTDPANRKLEMSLREFGIVEPLVWNEKSGRLVGGHARLRILKSMGVAEVPVSVVQLDEAREKALNVVLNNQEAQGRFDTAKLAKLLTELEDLPEFAMTGFDPAVLRQAQVQVNLVAAGGIIAVDRDRGVRHLPEVSRPARVIEDHRLVKVFEISGFHGGKKLGFRRRPRGSDPPRRECCKNRSSRARST